MWCICCIKVLVNELWPIRFEYSTALWYNDELQATQVPKNTVHNTLGLFFCPVSFISDRTLQSVPMRENPACFDNFFVGSDRNPVPIHISTVYYTSRSMLNITQNFLSNQLGYKWNPLRLLSWFLFMETFQYKKVNYLISISHVKLMQAFTF